MAIPVYTVLTYCVVNPCRSKSKLCRTVLMSQQARNSCLQHAFFSRAKVPVGGFRVWWFYYPSTAHADTEYQVVQYFSRYAWSDKGQSTRLLAAIHFYLESDCRITVLWINLVSQFSIWVLGFTLCYLLPSRLYRLTYLSRTLQGPTYDMPYNVSSVAWPNLPKPNRNKYKHDIYPNLTADILCSCPMKRVTCTLCSTWSIMLCLVIPISCLRFFIQIYLCLWPFRFEFVVNLHTFDIYYSERNIELVWIFIVRITASTDK